MSNTHLLTANEEFPMQDPSVRTYRVHDEAVLAGGRAYELLALNATAHAVWDCCDGTKTVGEIAEHIARDYGCAPQDIAEDVRTIVAHFDEKRLLRMHRPGVPTSNGRPVTFYVTFGQQYVEAYINAPDLVRRFASICEAMHTPGDGIPLGRIEVHGDGETYRLRSSWGSKSTVTTKYDAITWLKRRFVRRFVRARPDLLWFHAGAVSRNDEAVLCLGQGGSGKSTLLTALYKEGWAYFSDDVLPYDPATGCVLPFPLTPVYRQGGERIMTPEELRQLPKKHVRLKPSRVALDPAPVCLVVFPRFEPDNPKGATKRSPASAVVKLSEHCFNKRGYCGDLVQAFSDLIEQAPTYDVEHNADLPSLEEVRPLLPGDQKARVAAL